MSNIPVKFIGGPQHGRILHLHPDFYEPYDVFSVRPPMNSHAVTVVSRVVTKQTSYRRVYYRGRPLNHAGLEFMIDQNMKHKDSKILQRVIREKNYG